MSSEVQTVHPALAASVHAPTAGSGSGGKRPDRRDGDRRPPDRGPGKVTKKKKKRKKWCLGCGEWTDHTLDECRVHSNVLSNLAISTTRTIAAASSRGQNRVPATGGSRPQTRVLATGGSRPQVGRPHPLGPRQLRPRMNGPNSRERREAQRVAAGLWRPQQPQQQTQLEQTQEQPLQPSAGLPVRLAHEDVDMTPHEINWADDANEEAEKNPPF